MAAITRDQYEDYRRRFQPIEDRLIEMYQNGPTAEDYQEGVDASFARQDLANEVNQRRFGIQVNDQQQKALTQRSELAKGLSSVDASNRFAIDDEARTFEALSGSPGRKE